MSSSSSNFWWIFTQQKNDFVRKTGWQEMVENMRCSVKSPFDHGLEDMQEYISLPFTKADASKLVG